MKRCAYCSGQGKKFTKEHVIPNWYIEHNKSPNDVSFLERAPKKFISEMVIRDVCDECNNRHLSGLDAYGKELYNRYFEHYVFEDEIVEFKYNYQRLLKWLIKCSYNSARVHNADLEVLKDYAEILIGDLDLPADVLVFCSLTAPARIDADDIPSIANRNYSGELYEPSWFRLGVFRVTDFDSIDYCFRTVIIHSFTFYLVLPKLKGGHSKERQKLLSELYRSDTHGARITQEGRIKLGPPNIEAIGSFVGQMANNPVSYELEDDAFAKQIREEDPENILYFIPRADIEEGNTADLEAFFLYLTSSREVALLCMQKIEFSIDGYNDDPRELCEISDVVRYVGKLNKLFPYWLFYQKSKGRWLEALLVCLGNETAVRNEGSVYVEFDGVLLQRHINRWFLALNELSHRFSISETLNRKISQELIDLVERLTSTTAQGGLKKLI